MKQAYFYSLCCVQSVNEVSGNNKLPMKALDPCFLWRYFPTLITWKKCHFAITPPFAKSTKPLFEPRPLEATQQTDSSAQPITCMYTGTMLFLHQSQTPRGSDDLCSYHRDEVTRYLVPRICPLSQRSTFTGHQRIVLGIKTPP